MHRSRHQPRTRGDHETIRGWHLPSRPGGEARGGRLAPPRPNAGTQRGAETTATVPGIFESRGARDRTVTEFLQKVSLSLLAAMRSNSRGGTTEAASRPNARVHLMGKASTKSATLRDTLTRLPQQIITKRLLPNRRWLKNAWSDLSAASVIIPLASGERTTSRNGVTSSTALKPERSSTSKSGRG